MGSESDGRSTDSLRNIECIGSTKTPNKKARSIRDHRVDSLRGLMLVIMTIDHLGGPFSKLTFEPLGFVSAAEGFVFLSGYMYALVYARRADSIVGLWHQTLKRAVFIYRYHLLCLALIAGSGYFFATLTHYWSLGDITAHPVLWSLASLSLINTPIFFDILPMYVVFVLLTPLAVWGVRSGMGWLVLAVSVAAWCAARAVHPVATLGEMLPLPVRTTFFNLLAWQLIWTLGVLLGCYRDTIQGVVTRTRPSILIAPLVVIGILFLARHDILWFGLNPTGSAISRGDLGWLRLIDDLCVIALGTFLMRYIPIGARLPWFDALGQASLQVFSFHLMLVYATLIIGWHLRNLGGAPLFELYTVFCLALLTIPAHLTSRQRRRGYMKSVMPSNP